MLEIDNALLPGTCVPVHRHPRSNENVLCLRGRLDEIIYDVRSTGSASSGGSLETDLVEVERISLCPAEGRYGCVIPAGAWHTVEVIEPHGIKRQIPLERCDNGVPWMWG